MTIAQYKFWGVNTEMSTKKLRGRVMILNCWSIFRPTVSF